MYGTTFTTAAAATTTTATSSVPQHRRRPTFEDVQTVSSSSDSSSGEGHNPFQAFRPSLFVSLASPLSPPGAGGDENDDLMEVGTNANDTLPSLHDRSWIGARMSPIHKQNDDDDHENRGTMNTNINNNNDSFFRLQPPSTSQQQLPPFWATASSSAAKQEAFHLHPLQQSIKPLGKHAFLSTPVHAASSYPKFWPPAAWLGTLGTLICGTSVLCLLGMGIYDIYDYRTTKDSNYFQAYWTLPWFQPSAATKITWGGLVPEPVILASVWNGYARILSSSLQCNSMMEWFLIVLAWFVCQRPSVYVLSTTTLACIYLACVWTGQSWMLAVWWVTRQVEKQDNFNNNQVVAQCAAWGTCGVLCFVGMVRPQRRFGCFMICIMLVILSLLQAMELWTLPTNKNNGNPYEMDNDNSLPLVVGCTASAFVGWAIFGSHLLGPTTKKRADPMSTIMMMGTPLPQRRPPPHAHSLRVACTVLVMFLWMVPLLILAFYDGYFYLPFGKHQNE